MSAAANTLSRMDRSLAAADSHDVIRVVGSRENNLRGISLDIPKRRLTVFTGVSGSGKSSLVFGTIAAESQRLINETYSTFIQDFMPRIGRPDADPLGNLSAAIVVDQQRLGADSRSTLGTATDVHATLRIVFQPALHSRTWGGSFSFRFQRSRGDAPGVRGAGPGHRPRPRGAGRPQQDAQRGRDPRNSQPARWMGGTCGSTPSRPVPGGRQELADSNLFFSSGPPG